VNMRRTFGSIIMYLMGLVLYLTHFTMTMDAFKSLSRGRLRWSFEDAVVKQRAGANNIRELTNDIFFTRWIHSQKGTQKRSFVLNAEVLEFGGAEEDGDDEDTRTDEEKGATHGYEGNFKVGDIVRVVVSTKIYSVKQHRENGFDPKGLVGKVSGLALYGRKQKSLCSAITPVKVTFIAAEQAPERSLGDVGKFTLHFSGKELELISQALVKE